MGDKNQLLELWEKNEAILENKHIKQLINLISDVEEEKRYIQLREFLQKISNKILSKFTLETINGKYDQSGFVLQELVNEIGRRLGFEIEYGIHRGRKNKIGFDGIWTTKDEYSIIIESKKTDAFSFDLDVIDGYRRKLIEAEKVTEEKSSILIIRGKEERRCIEEQIRGSKHAWNMRIIGVEALLKLLEIKSNWNDEKTLQQIYEVLKPQEYTKIDKLIDLIFFTTEDSKLDDNTEKEEKNINGKYDESLKTLEEKLKIKLEKKLNTLYATNDKETGIIMCASKQYLQGKENYYWFAYHPYFYDNLKEYKNRYIAYICEKPENILLIPVEKIDEWKENISKTDRKDGRSHWHITIFDKSNEFKLKLKGRNNFINITEYKK